MVIPMSSSGRQPRTSGISLPTETMTPAGIAADRHRRCAVNFTDLMGRRIPVFHKNCVSNTLGANLSNDVPGRRLPRGQ